MNKQEEIRFLMQTYGIKLSWLADKLNMKTQTLSYLINDTPRLEEEIYNEIKKVIGDYQLELDLFHDTNVPQADLFSEENLHLGIGERMRIFAKRKYKTLKGLSDAMKISPQQLQQYVSGRREPGAKILIKLLQLGCDINWLLGGAESLESYKVYKLERELIRYETIVKQIKSELKKLDG